MRVLWLVFFLVFSGVVSAQETITGFEDKDKAILNEELRKDRASLTREVDRIDTALTTVDAVTVDGYNTSATPAASSIPVTNAAGYLTPFLEVYDSGWVAQGDQTLTHNLGTTKILLCTYAATDANGANMAQMGHEGDNAYGFEVYAITTTQCSIKMKGNIGYIWNGSAWVNTWTHLRVIAIALE